jgi:hypothetical protein
MKVSTALFASVVAICCLSFSIYADEKFDDTKKAAEQGDARAQNSLGQMYVSGQGVPQDYKEALKWFRLAAEQGHEDAQFGLAVMYITGDGV